MGELALALAMIDVSDGLAQDLGHVCIESGVSAVLDFDRVPVSKAVGSVLKGTIKSLRFCGEWGRRL